MNASPTQISSPWGVSKCQGSALISAIIFTVILSLLCASFMSLAMQERKMASRLLENNSLMNVAEAGLEEAIYAINNNDWTNWQIINGGKDAYLKRNSMQLGSNRTNTYHVLVQGFENSAVIYSEAFATLTTGGEISKQLRIEYDTVTSSSAPGGLIAKGLLEFSGQPVIGAYSSELGKPPMSDKVREHYENKGFPWADLQKSPRLDQVMVATVSKEDPSFKVSGQVDIYGYAGTGKHYIETSGPQNKIVGADTDPADVKSGIDQTRVSLDFVYDFPDVIEPDWAGARRSLPSVTKVKGVETMVLGNSGAVTKYKIDKLDMSGQTVVQVDGPVVIHLEDGMSMSGQAYIEILDGGSLEIYTPKDVSISGQGFVNKTSNPSNIKVFGTVGKEKDQSLNLSGQGLIEAVFYMPNAVAKVSGQGDLAGSLVAHEVTYSGQGYFHYDVTLGNGDDGSGDPSVSSWHELRESNHKVDLDDYVQSTGGSV